MSTKVQEYNSTIVQASKLPQYNITRVREWNITRLQEFRITRAQYCMKI